jgi:hypothetical protein
MRTTLTCLTLASLTTATALGVASCQQAPWIVAGAPARQAPPGPLWNEPQLTKMIQAYRRKLPAKSRALRFEMYNNIASLDLLDPSQRKKVASYDYKDGELKGPSPFDPFGVFQDSNLDDNVFDWDQVALERIPALVIAALTQTQLVGAKVVAVRVTRQAPSSDEIGRRIQNEIKARTRAMERKLRRARDAVASGEPEVSDKAQHFGDPFAPLAAVEISVQLQAPGGFGWLTADVTGTITGSGVDRDEKGPAADIEKQAVPRPQPYWRSRIR